MLPATKVYIKQNRLRKEKTVSDEDFSNTEL